MLKNYSRLLILVLFQKVLKKLYLFKSISILVQSHQSAYRKHHNTEIALLKSLMTLLLSADQKKISVLSLDLSAAFDIVQSIGAKKHVDRSLCDKSTKIGTAM